MSLESEAAALVRERGHDARTAAGRDPAAAVDVLVGLAAGTPKLTLQRETGICRHTIGRMEKENIEWVDGWRRRELVEIASQAEKARRLNNLKLDELLEDGEARAKVSVKDLAVTQAVYLDKFDRLSNQPGLRVEHTVTAPRLSDAGEALARLRAARGRVVDVDVEGEP